MWGNPPITHSHNSSKIQQMGFSLNDFWLHLFPFRDKSTTRETERQREKPSERNWVSGANEGKRTKLSEAEWVERTKASEQRWAKLSERNERRWPKLSERNERRQANEGERSWVSGANEGKRTKVSETEWAERTKASEQGWASEWSEVKKLTEIIGTSLSRNREINQEKMMGLKLRQKASSYHYCIPNDCLYFNMTIIEIYSHMNFNFLSQNNFIYMIVL